MDRTKQNRDEVAKSGDEKAILDHMSTWFFALNSGNADDLPVNKHTRFDVDGGLLETNDPEVGLPKLKEAFAAGLTIDVQPLHEKVDLYGDTAVYTCYERVKITPPEGDPINDTRRATVVLAKQTGEWKDVHVHLSYLTPVNPK